MYLSDMKSLAESDPEIWREFMDGNWVVNKNANPFFAIGADHGLEQVNQNDESQRRMSLALLKTIML